MKKKRKTELSSKLRFKEEGTLKTNEINKIKSSIFILNHELDKRLNDTKRLNNEIKEAHKITIEKQKQLEKLQEKHSKTLHNKEVLRQEIEQKNYEIQHLEHELALINNELQLERKHNKEETTKLRETTSKQQKELEENTQSHSQTQEKFSNIKKKIEDKDFELIKKEQKIESLIDENNKLKEIINHKDNQATMLKETIVKKNEIINQLNKDIDTQ